MALQGRAGRPYRFWLDGAFKVGRADLIGFGLMALQSRAGRPYKFWELRFYPS